MLRPNSWEVYSKGEGGREGREEKKREGKEREEKGRKERKGKEVPRSLVYFYYVRTYIAASELVLFIRMECHRNPFLVSASHDHTWKYWHR